MEVDSPRTTHLGPGEGRVLRAAGGELVTCKIAAEQTGGAYSLFEVTSRPGGGPPPHVQHREDECFYVLEGEFEFLAEEDILRVSAGSLVYVPRGTLHAHRNVGEGVGQLLISQTPGGSHERFYEEIGEEVADGKIAEIATKYGIEIVGKYGKQAKQETPLE
jgi:mannose-6-phosphate isomerase-like protein (cupin superfamily)